MVRAHLKSACLRGCCRMGKSVLKSFIYSTLRPCYSVLMVWMRQLNIRGIRCLIEALDLFGFELMYDENGLFDHLIGK